MKDLLSKEYYCYKIHALLMKVISSQWLRPSHFYTKILILYFYDFSESHPTISKGGSHYVHLEWNQKSSG